jgi:23S rRNA pseudouridine955/2504/2580 synthase
MPSPSKRPPGGAPAAARRSAAAAVREAPEQVSYLTIEEGDAGQRLDNFLLRVAKGVPKSHIYRIVRSGEVRVNRGRARAEQRLVAGDRVRIPPLRVAGPASAPARAPAAMPPVLFEDDDVLAVDKPSGVAAHGGSGVSFGLIEQVRAARPEQPFLELVHRLDRETSGILLLAKSRRALTGLHRQLREGRVEKHYLALVRGDWVNDRQHVRAALRKYVTASGERRVSVDPEGAEAHTVFTLRRRLGAYSLIEAELRTGRTHQIRVHLAHLGFPIVGDDKYGDFALNRQLGGAARGPRLRRMFLHAARVRFEHPVTGRPIDLVSPLPRDCEDFLREVAHA